MMRFLPILLVLLSPLLASEPVYPLWDGHESVADYAKRVNLPPTKSLDLGGGVKLELVLIPAGKFIMGTGKPDPQEPKEPTEPAQPTEPPPLDEEGFHKDILTGQWLVSVSAIAWLVMLCGIIVVAFHKRQRPKYSLLWLSLMTAIAGGSGLDWRRSVKNLEEARAQYAAANDAAWVQYRAAKEQVDELRARYAIDKARFDARYWVGEMPRHPVTLTQPFYMGKFMVTQRQYQQVIGTNPSHFIGRDNPVETVSGYDTETFCKKATEQSKQSVRLPTEAEWEFACRAGTTSKYYSGETEADLDRVAWYDGNSKNTTHPVGQKEPNRFGLYDMLGNVLQRCSDQVCDDPIFRVCRGASDDLNFDRYWSADRIGICQCASTARIGFRVVVPADRAP